MRLSRGAGAGYKAAGAEANARRCGCGGSSICLSARVTATRCFFSGHVRTLAVGIPIVFIGVGDPVANGLVESLSRPGGNTTGVGTYPPSISGKWLELLKDAAPRVTRVAVWRPMRR